MDRVREGNGNDTAINIAICLAAVAALVLGGWEVWRAWDTSTAPVYKIRKDQWACTRSRQFHTLILSGKHERDHDQVRTICDQYTRSNRPAPP